MNVKEEITRLIEELPVNKTGNPILNLQPKMYADFLIKVGELSDSHYVFTNVASHVPETYTEQQRVHLSFNAPSKYVSVESDTIFDKGLFMTVEIPFMYAQIYNRILHGHDNVISKGYTLLFDNFVKQTETSFAVENHKVALLLNYFSNFVRSNILKTFFDLYSYLRSVERAFNYEVDKLYDNLEAHLRDNDFFIVGGLTRDEVDKVLGTYAEYGGLFARISEFNNLILTTSGSYVLGLNGQVIVTNMKSNG